MRQEREPLHPRLGQQLEAGAQRQHLNPEIPEHRRTAPVVLKAGDVLGCQYKVVSRELGGCKVCKSILALFVNNLLAFQFEFDGQLPDKPLYAVVDVCYFVYQVSMVTENEQLLMGG